MTVSQIVKVILISFIIITSILLIINMILSIKRSLEMKSLPSKKRKKKKVIKKQLKGSIKKIIIDVILLIILLGGYFAFVSYDNSTINGTDSDSVVRAYFLIDDFSKEIEKAAAESTDRDASTQNIKYLTLSMSTYANKNANDSNTVEGQQLINRYYRGIGQLGMNATRDMKSFYGNENNVLDSYKEELQQLKMIENKVFDFYKVNKNSLENEGQKKE